MKLIKSECFFAFHYAFFENMKKGLLNNFFVQVENGDGQFSIRSLTLSDFLFLTLIVHKIAAYLSL